MNLFIIVYNGRELEERIVQTYPDRHHLVREGVCAIATGALTPADVCEALDFAHPPNEERTAPALEGVVFRLHEDYGRYDLALWQRLQAWTRDD